MHCWYIPDSDFNLGSFFTAFQPLAWIDYSGLKNNSEVSENAKQQAKSQLIGNGSGRATTQPIGDLQSQGAIQGGLGLSGEMINEAEIIATQGERISKTMEAIRDNAQLIGAEVGNAMANFTGKFVDALGLADDGMQGFVKNMAKTITELLSMLLANAIANAIAGATAGALGTGPAAPFTQPAFIATMVGGVLSAFAAIPKFADGGIVSGTTLGLVGEYSGARNNPEVIAPLDRLKSLLGETGGSQNVVVTGRLSGQDILLSNQRATNNRNRRS